MISLSSQVRDWGLRGWLSCGHRARRWWGWNLGQLISLSLEAICADFGVRGEIRASAHHSLTQRMFWLQFYVGACVDADTGIVRTGPCPSWSDGRRSQAATQAGLRTSHTRQAWSCRALEMASWPRESWSSEVESRRITGD